MAEFLFMIDPARRRPGQQIGEPTMVAPDGHPWGAGELDATVFRLVKVPTLGLALAKAIFLRNGVPRLVTQAAEAAKAAMIAAKDAVPFDQAAFDVAWAEYQRLSVIADHWPRRRFHVDLSALGVGGTKTAVRLRDASLRKGLEAFRDARLAGSTPDVSLAAAIAAATPVTDFTTAATED